MQKKVKNYCSRESGMRWQYTVPKWNEIVKRLGTPALGVHAPGAKVASHQYFTTSSCPYKRADQKGLRILLLENKKLY